jgi:hypothetical protein
MKRPKSTKKARVVPKTVKRRQNKTPH